MPFGNIGLGEMVVLCIVALLIFGGKLPEVARKVGQGISEFRRGLKEEARRIEHELDVPPPAAPAPVTPGAATTSAAAPAPGETPGSPAPAPSDSTPA